MKLQLLAATIGFTFCTPAFATKLFIPMDATGQTNHLKAYGVAFTAMQQGTKVDWLLNYKGGSFAMEYAADLAARCTQDHITFSKITDKQYNALVKKVKAAGANSDVVSLEHAPKIAVYTPPGKKPWDDAVTLALTYAGIPFEKLYANEVLAGDLDKYDWLHLHHEDFTGQYGKFYASFSQTSWYQEEQKSMEAMATKNGYKKVSQMQLAVVKKIRDFVGRGGNLFAMCSATDTYDIALAAEGTDICAPVYDGDPVSTPVKLDYTNCFAFKDFSVSGDAYAYVHSDIDNTNFRISQEEFDTYKLAAPAAKYDQVATMLCQNHATTIKAFMGQTTAYRKDKIKPGVQILADGLPNEARYIHGEFGKGTWTFFGGHDPEDYQHMIYDAPTNLAEHPNSPGYRLILNNALFPAVKREVVPTVFMSDATAKTEPTQAATASTTNTPNITLVDRIRMAPNPANNELVITLSAGGENGASRKIENVTILSMSGKEVFNHNYQSEKATVDLKDIPSGIYMVHVNGQYGGKIVKE